MAQVHVVYTDLKKVNATGQVLMEGSPVLRTNYSEEHRVMPNPNVPNTWAQDSEGNQVALYPTIEEFLIAEAVADFLPQIINQYMIVTVKT